MKQSYEGCPAGMKPFLLLVEELGDNIYSKNAQSYAHGMMKGYTHGVLNGTKFSKCRFDYAYYVPPDVDEKVILTFCDGLHRDPSSFGFAKAFYESVEKLKFYRMPAESVMKMLYDVEKELNPDALVGTTEDKWIESVRKCANFNILSNEVDRKVSEANLRKGMIKLGEDGRLPPPELDVTDDGLYAEYFNNTGADNNWACYIFSKVKEMETAMKN